MDASRIETPVAAPPLAPRRLIGVIGLTLALAYLVMLSGAWLQGQFLTDAENRPIANDFVDVYAAGRMALSGDAASAYDWPLHKAAEVRALGHDFSGYYGWHYPPPFLFVAAVLALLPYLGAVFVWLAGTLAAYALTLRCILRDRAGIFVALGFPAAIWNVTAGQNGFLTAALIGGTLAALERRPALAGVLLGLLTYKPQFGLLFPLALIADRRWLTIAVAAAVASGMAAASALVFGAASWQAFFHWLPITSHRVLGEGVADFDRLQSLYGLVRAHDGSEALAFAVQAISQHRGRHRNCLALAQPRAVRPEGRRARRRDARRHALCLHVRRDRARGRCRLSAALCAGARIYRPPEYAASPQAPRSFWCFPTSGRKTGLAAVLIVLALIVSRLALDEPCMEPA